MHVESTRHHSKHSHALVGLGMLDDGAQRSMSGRGTVAAYNDDLITSNPEEVRDG